MKKIILLLILLSSCNNKDWAYNGKNNPANWGKIRDEYKFCQYGFNQSPIDISKDLASDFIDNPLKFNYSNSEVEKFPQKYNLQFNFYGKSYLEKNRKKYNLRFLTFRHPSEHLLESKNHSLEMQIYHKSEDEQWLVVSYFLEIADDLTKNNVKFDSLIDFIISKKNEDIFNLAEIIDPQGLVFFYDGSFTTPPCYEGVKWYVFQKPIIISKEQMLTLIKKTIFVKSNVRQVQKFNPEKF